MASWLRDEARGELPDWVLRSTFEQTRSEPQKRGVRSWMARLRSRIGNTYEPPDKGGSMFTMMRVTTAAVLFALVGTGLLISMADGPASVPGAPAAESSPSDGVLFELTIPPDALGDHLSKVGVERWIVASGADAVIKAANEAYRGRGIVVDEGEFDVTPFAEALLWRAADGPGAARSIAPAGELTTLTAGDAIFLPVIPEEELDPRDVLRISIPGDGDATAWSFHTHQSVGSFLGYPEGLTIGAWDASFSSPDMVAPLMDGGAVFRLTRSTVDPRTSLDIADAPELAIYHVERGELEYVLGAFSEGWPAGRRGGVVWPIASTEQTLTATADEPTRFLRLDVMPASLGVTTSGDTAEMAVAEELFAVTLDEDAIPEQLAGVLFFKKQYPTDQEISYSSSFIPPNTFVRYVEAGELGISPKSETQVLRAGAAWPDAEMAAAGAEAVVGVGDAFVMTDVPYDEFSHDALGEMWTPGEDAQVVGFAIRESSRCCAMTHSGMISPWYSTLSGSGVEELRGQPVTLRILRWDIPPATSLPPSADEHPTLRFLESGVMLASVVADQEAVGAGEPWTYEFKASQPLRTPALEEGEMAQFDNIGEEPAVVYQLIAEPADEAAGISSSPGFAVVDAGRMAKSRSGHSATRLPDGRVLITGGGWADAELFDPETGAFDPAGKQARIRSTTATLLDDGRVLLAGSGQPSAELYDPVSQTFSETGPMVDERRLHSATLLDDGRVLIVGGETYTAELYDPATGSFEQTGEISGRRTFHAATWLPDGKILISGGGLPPAETYDPPSGTFQPVPSVTASREHHTLTLLDDGRVLIVGDVGRAEIYDPETGVSEMTGQLNIPRYHHAATLLPDGRVLITGGMTLLNHEPSASIEVYDPSTGIFSDAGFLLRVRLNHTATMLGDDRVLVAGGTSSGSASTTASVEIIETAPTG